MQKLLGCRPILQQLQMRVKGAMRPPAGLLALTLTKLINTSTISFPAFYYRPRTRAACDTECVACAEVGSTINGSTAGGGRVLILQPGVHTFPFKLGLPLGLPSTFLGKHGWVQYFCKALMKDPSGLVHKNQQVFIIMNPIDLSLEPPVLTVSLSASDAIVSNYNLYFAHHYFYSNRFTAKPRRRSAWRACLRVS